MQLKLNNGSSEAHRKNEPPRDGEKKKVSGIGGYRRDTSTRPQTAYFVYLLVGVHNSHAEAKRAYAGLRFAERLPVMFERNENGMGKCKTWLAVSQPYDRRGLADAAQRQLVLYTGDGAVSIRRGSVR